jgi:RNA polymerase-binding protein DksA
MARAESKTKKTAVLRPNAGTTKKTTKSPEAAKSNAAKSNSGSRRSGKQASKQAAKSVKAAPAKAVAVSKRTTAKRPAPRPATGAAAAKKAPAKKAAVVAKKAPPAKKSTPPKTPAVKSDATKPATAKKAPVAKRPEAPQESASGKQVESVTEAEPVKRAVRKTTVICPLSGFEVKRDKPNLSPRTVERLRSKLLEERARHLSQADQLQAEAAQLALDREEGDTQFDEEGGEGDTISVERERDLMLSASARQIVEEIDRALERIKNKTYGLCTPAGRRISVERLEALPYAETCVDCKARAERRR